ncbi:universal stress protein [Rhodococcus sp. D2-41]|uniref:Universal stress protein n=1 Tax=Speluncibacter jeojiensis TaxID=2710754 RepID=A0A9X4M5N6_9ACTN|nr:universal stress protein [Rhodococcus sp. D2-41]MDG3009493.1 universal stress protein [Rhodococcus sp. D2-41]MDG3016422.1 universal stress protein [Corynebacteriales bacterium D3-21]
MDINPPIVVGVDGSDHARIATRWAAETAARRTAPLQLVCASPPPPPFGVATALPQDFYEDRLEVGKKLLTEATELAKDAVGEHPLEVRREFHTAPPARVLLTWSESAHMIVLGSRGLGQLAGGFLGSVSASVAAHADCPVVALRGPAPTTGPVVVGVDGSPLSEFAIDHAFEEASLRGAPLVAAHAWNDLSLRQAFGFHKDLEWPDIKAEEAAVLAESLAGRRERYPDVEVTEAVDPDRPVQMLKHLTTDAQLVVVGSRGRGGFRGMLLGSTSRSLLHVAECPVMVVRPRG